MRALRWLGRLFDNVTGRRSWIGACSDIRGTSASTTAIGDTVDASPYIVRNIERTICSHRQATGTVLGFGRRFHRPSKTIRKDFAPAGCVIPRQRLINHVVTALRIGRAIPGAVEGNEDTAAIVLWKLRLVVQHHGVWRPVRRVISNCADLVRTCADCFSAVAAVFRRQSQLFPERVVVACGPAVVSVWPQKQQLFRRQRGLLFGL